MKRKIAVGLIFFSLWTLFVLYPNPYRLGVSGARIINPAVNADAVSHLLDELPESPEAIEAYVLAEIVPYQYDWQSYGVPFYFPKVEEVLARGKGDCKSRFVVLASIFEALDIPYEKSFSLSHFWITYEGKEETKMESTKNAFLVDGEEGKSLQIPKESLSDSFEVVKAGFWDVMPGHRKALLMMGPVLSILLVALFGAKQKAYQSYKVQGLSFSEHVRSSLKESQDDGIDKGQKNEA